MTDVGATETSTESTESTEDKAVQKMVYVGSQTVAIAMNGRVYVENPEYEPYMVTMSDAKNVDFVFDDYSTYWVEVKYYSSVVHGGTSKREILSDSSSAFLYVNGNTYACDDTARISSFYTQGGFDGVSASAIVSGTHMCTSSYSSQHSSPNVIVYCTINVYECFGVGDSLSSSIYDVVVENQQTLEENQELQKEQNEITGNIFDSITDFFGSFFDNLINAITGVFVPEDGYFEDYFQRLNDFFSEKLGLLYAPIDIFVDVMNAISAGGGSSGITFPEVKWEEYVLIEEQTIDLQEIADGLGELQDYIYLGTNVIMVGAVLGLFQTKLKEVLTE